MKVPVPFLSQSDRLSLAVPASWRVWKANTDGIPSRQAGVTQRPVTSPTVLITSGGLANRRPFMNAWSQPGPFNEVCSRAGWTRRYKALRRDPKLFRRRDVLELVVKYRHKPGVQARIATVLGVSEATVSRDISATLCAPNLCRECGGYKS